MINLRKLTDKQQLKLFKKNIYHALCKFIIVFSFKEDKFYMKIIFVKIYHNINK